MPSDDVNQIPEQINFPRVRPPFKLGRSIRTISRVKSGYLGPIYNSLPISEYGRPFPSRGQEGSKHKRRRVLWMSTIIDISDQHISVAASFHCVDSLTVRRGASIPPRAYPNEAMTKLSFEETLIEVWRQALVENAKAVKVGGESYPVRRTPKLGLREVDFTFDGDEIRGLEQNPDAKSRWAQLARSGKKVMQFLSEGRYVANVVDGKVTRYGRAR